MINTTISSQLTVTLQQAPPAPQIPTTLILVGYYESPDFTGTGSIKERECQELYCYQHIQNLKGPMDVKATSRSPAD